MNHICEPGHAVAMTSFTAEQGQHLAYIYEYTSVLGRPWPKPICNDASA